MEEICIINLGLICDNLLLNLGRVKIFISQPCLHAFDLFLDNLAIFYQHADHRIGKLVGWLKDMGYEESPFDEQIEKFSRLDRETLLVKAGSETKSGRGDRIPLGLLYHLALNGLGDSSMGSPLYAFQIQRT